ncbi:MAG: hypothetical protein JEZ07_17440 [Phycisphaerae bacterium]|nr:hypothetical protein [Phycisphaerae bacterium]
MVNFDSEKTQNLNLSPKELAILMHHCSGLIDDEILRKLFSATNGMLILTKQQAHNLRLIVDVCLTKVLNPDEADILSQIFKKLSPNYLTRQISEQMAEREFGSLEDLQEFTNSFMEKQNNIPDPELGGFTPAQAHKLLYTEWDNPECSMKLSHNLSFEEVKGIPLYHNAITLLKTLIDLKESPTVTAKGNLNRKAVKAMLDDFMIDEETFSSIFKYNKVINELDVFDIWRTRQICYYAGLIRKQKNKFIVTRKAQNLLSPENAGKLYPQLFLAFFRKFSMVGFDHLSELDDFQATMVFSIFQLSLLAKKEIRFEKIYKKLALPAIVEYCEEIAERYVPVSTQIDYRIIKPLMYAGLLDCKYKKVDYFMQVDTVRINKVFQEFISFTL